MMGFSGRLLVCALFVFSVHDDVAANQHSRVGRAYDKDSGALLYEERHVERLDGEEVVGAEVLYLDARGHIFAVKQVDFRANPLAPEFHLHNRRTGHLEALRRLAEGTVEVRFQAAGSSQAIKADLLAPPGSLADAGFDRFIEANWDELLKGDPMLCRFLVPSRLEFMNFRVRHRDAGHDRDIVHFALELDSALLRLLVPSITVAYDRATRRLLRYEGMSNIRDATGDNHDVRIEFDYGEPNELTSRTKLPEKLL
ncbi:MAG: hypothetical protein ACI9W2_003348 [Gammaproteobacteria bacterium]|jgi:hypothetical protein